MEKSTSRIPRFELADLRLFVAVADAGSLTQGAARLPLAPSAASARLRSLEDRLGMPLFDRTATGLTPTPAGTVFLEHARRVTHAAQDAQASMDALHHDGRTVLRILSNHMGLSTDLPTRLGQFLALHPSLDIQLEQFPSRDVLKAVEDGQAALGILDQSVSSPGVIMMPYRRDKLVVLLPAGHPLSDRPSCSFAEVLSYPLVGMEASSSLQVFVEQMAMMGHLAARFRVRAPTFSAAAGLVAENAGVAFMPEPAARMHQAMLPVVTRELTDSWAIRDLLICMRTDIGATGPTRRLAMFLSG